MNSEFNEMERMFAEGLQNYEVTPPAHVWSNIQKRKRKGLLFYKWRTAAVLLLLCIAGTSAYYFINNEKLDTLAISKKGKNSTTTNSNPEIKTDKNPILSEEIITEENNTSKLSNLTSDTKNKEVKTRKTREANTPKVSGRDEIVKEVSDNENKVYDIRDLFFNIPSKEKIKLRYIMYPTLTQYVYTTKKLGKKHILPKIDDERNNLDYKYSIELVCGPSYAFRILSGNSGLRDESENANLSIQTGVKVNFHLNSKWSLQSGLILENRNEKIKYNQTEIREKLTETSRQVIVRHPILQDKTITVIDSEYSKENVEYKFNTTNKYTSLNIPVVLGYNFSLGKLQYRFSAGPLFNVYSMNTASNLVRHDDKIELAPYKESTKIKTSVYSAVALLYPWNSQYSGMIEISYYNNLTNRLNNEAVLRQRNYGFNISTGIKINILK